MGASKWYIVNVVLRETLLLAAAGIVAGIIISLVTRHVIMFEKPVLRLFWSNEWVLRAAVIAVVGALAGALYPAFKAAQRDPIDALAYEYRRLCLECLRVFVTRIQILLQFSCVLEQDVRNRHVFLHHCPVGFKQSGFVLLEKPFSLSPGQTNGQSVLVQ
jgi:TRAP-type uncharacterized transport system fused permease subunit